MTQKISLIWAMDEAGGIGKNKTLLCHLPADLQYFKDTTLQKPIVMGRKTYESIGRPLPHRENIVLSHSVKSIDQVHLVHSKDEVLQLSYPEIMIIGGAEIYQLFLPHATDLYLTRIHHRFDADVYFPNVDWSQWKLVSSVFRPEDKKNMYPLTFEIFHKKRVDNSV